MTVNSPSFLNEGESGLAIFTQDDVHFFSIEIKERGRECLCVLVKV